MADIGRNINGAYDKGFDAFEAGWKHNDCPYKEPNLAAAWRAGWCASFQVAARARVCPPVKQRESA